ncbi:MAG TPA: M15 family metallopeptidase [Pyrinomonadaceae bacterium]|nr:M15 family metallopeptidase [Pyrinomonadaceae bacterium]
MKTYLNKTFVVDDPQARLRKPDDLLSYVMENGVPKMIPNGTQVQLSDVKLVQGRPFVLAENWGWTAGDNLKGDFLNETLGEFPPTDNNQKGPNAAWDKGHFLKQLTLIQVIGANRTVKFVSKDIIQFYLALVNDAAADGVVLPLKSGFRTYAEQQYLYNGWINEIPGFNLAAEPGKSNHQDGYAYDFAITSYEGNPMYDWLKANAPSHGFVRTVNKEPWHWEYRPEVAATGAYKTANVTK